METESLQRAGNDVVNISDNETYVTNSQILTDNTTNICGICKWKHFYDFIHKYIYFILFLILI